MFEKSMQLLPSLLFVSSRIQVNGKDVLMYPSVAARSQIGFNLALPPPPLSLAVRYPETIAKNIKNYVYKHLFLLPVCNNVLVHFNAMSDNRLTVLVL